MAQPKGTADDKPLLDLRTLDEAADFIRIDGKRYDLVNLDALPLRPRTKLAEELLECMRLIADFGGSKSFSKKKEGQLSRRVKALVPKLMPSMSSAVAGKLAEAHRQEIVMAFFVARSERASQTTIVEKTARVAERLTGESTSRVSKGSTAAKTSRRGTTRSRRRSSKPA